MPKPLQTRRAPWCAPLLAIAVLTVPTVTRAQAGAVQLQATEAPLTLPRALELARANGPGARTASARRDIAIGRTREQQQYPNPTIEWRRENLGSSLQPDIFATVYLPVDVTGRRVALRKAGAQGQQRATADATAARRDAELNAARSWLHAAMLRGQVEIARTQAASFDEVAAVDSTRAREGIVAVGVALRTGLEADRARTVLAVLQGEHARARAELARVVGVDDAGLLALGSLDSPAMPVAPDSATARNVAVAARPELAARDAGLREAEARLTAERRGVVGDWQLQGGSKETGGFLTGQVGLSVPFPVFNRNDGARQRARGEVAEARALRDDAHLAVRADAVAALSAYDAMKALAGSARTLAERGREVAAIARTSYREGQATLTELLDAERAAADAMTSQLRWAVDAWLARLELERALGARLDADSPLDLPLISSIRIGS